MRRILIFIAVLLALIATLLGFDVFSVDGDPHLIGWVAASLAAFYASHVVTD